MKLWVRIELCWFNIYSENTTVVSLNCNSKLLALSLTHTGQLIYEEAEPLLNATLDDDVKR